MKILTFKLGVGQEKLEAFFKEIDEESKISGGVFYSRHPDANDVITVGIPETPEEIEHADGWHQRISED